MSFLKLFRFQFQLFVQFYSPKYMALSNGYKNIKKG